MSEYKLLENEQIIITNKRIYFDKATILVNKVSAYEEEFDFQWLMPLLFFLAGCFSFVQFIIVHGFSIESFESFPRDLVVSLILIGIAVMWLLLSMKKIYTFYCGGFKKSIEIGNATLNKKISESLNLIFFEIPDLDGVPSRNGNK